MKKPKFRFVAQRNAFDCATASIAMATGYSYKNVAKAFFGDKGLKGKEVIKYLTDCGFALIIKELESWNHRVKANKEMLVPFAHAHLICCFPYTDDKYGHMFFMDHRGRCFDPGRRNEPVNALKDFFKIDLVIGIYYDK
jgi:hypothetical protein